MHIISKALKSLFLTASLKTKLNSHYVKEYLCINSKTFGFVEIVMSLDKVIKKKHPYIFGHFAAVFVAAPTGKT
jgi:hypothetical protein